MEYITAIELKSKMDNNENFTLLDIRESYECDICSIGGIHIPMNEVSLRVTELAQPELLVILCRSGKRAEALGNVLVQDYNLTNINILKGGILGWIEEIDNTLESY